MPLPDHPLRTSLTNELHARPFPAVTAPARIGFLVLKAEHNAVGRDAEADHRALQTLTDHYGLPAPDARARHYWADLPNAGLKWEHHTEVTTYTVIRSGLAAPFDGSAFDVLPKTWSDGAPHPQLTSMLIEVLPWQDEDEIESYLAQHFETESLVASYVLDGSALIAGGFRMDQAGHMRFCIFVRSGTGPRRIGRIAQRLCEIETYKSLSMLGFARARRITPDLVALDEALTSLLAEIDTREADDALAELLDIAAQIERHASGVSFRFSATEAYEPIVLQRIDALRESRFRGRQSLREFMLRRYDPAMRTVQSTQRKLNRMSERASNAAQLLRTRVDVHRSAQSQALLVSMDRRADAQLRLQKTVEGLSVVAISYYAVSLAGYVLAPIAKALHLDKATLMAICAVPIVGAVWWTVRRIRKKH